MSIKKINEFPEASGSLSPDDIFLFMDDPSGDKVTKRISLSELASIIEGGGAISGTTFQISTVDLHNGGVQNAQVLKFDNADYQSVITGPTPSSGNSSQRIIIQGQRAQGNGEGGDVYLWGGDADINGGDIKIYAGDADSNESGNGGYVNIDAGNGHNQGGQVTITAGNSSIQGGSVNINAGYPSGNVSITTNAGSWAFNTDGTVDLPSSTLNVGLNSLDLKSSVYAELYYQSGPSGTSNNYIEVSNNNSEAYLWTTYDGTHIQNVRANDGTNPSWNYEWHFRNDGKLEYPDGTTDSGGTVIAPGTYNIQSIDNTLIQTRANAQAKSWNFDINGHLILPSGSILSETNNTVSLMPPTAQSGQSLVIRPTAAVWSVDSSGYIVYGNPITISVNQQYSGGNYFGTVNYIITGSGVTQASLGRSLTGNVVFSGPGPETETITWTIPANSNITEFTLTLTSVDGTESTDPEIENDPALYYNFEFNAMPSGQFVTVTNNGISSSEHSHVHLVAGDPATVDIYLGDDDQYVKIEKDGGDVVVGTNLNNNQWTFGTDGRLTLPASGSITFPDNTTQTSAGVPSNTGLVPNSINITNIVSISQANYDALVTKNSTTLYVIS